MKFDAKTLNVLKSFSGLNPSIIFTPGNVISTISKNKSVIARATIDQSFDSRFAIADLKKFLGVFSLFKEPDIKINDTYMSIIDGNRSVDYRFASERVILAPPTKEINMSGDLITLSITDKILDEIQKALGVFSAPEISFVGDDGKIVMSTFDSKDQNSDMYKIEIGETDKSFRAVFNGEAWNFIRQSYDIELNTKKFARFTGKEVVDMTYIVGMNPISSKFE